MGRMSGRRGRLVALFVAVALGFIALFTASASAAPASEATLVAGASPARTCSSGYVHAYLSWGEKCLRVAQFCKVGNSEYRQYGFTCPSSGHLVTATRTARPAPKPSRPAGATAKCRDGTYSYSLHRSGTCSHHGGVAVWY